MAYQATGPGEQAKMWRSKDLRGQPSRRIYGIWWRWKKMKDG